MESRSIGRVLGGGALIAVLAVWAYFPAVRGDYLWDDDQYVQENANLRDAEGLRRIWVSPASSPQYYPAEWASPISSA